MPRTRGGASLDLLSLPLAPLLGEAGPGDRSLPMFGRVSSSGTSAPSVLSLMVPEYQMPGGTWARMCWRMSPSVPREVVVSDDPRFACPSPLLDGARI
jgi:hypothetical protein